ncbi:hypothetical protein HRbin06_00509 [archaeon HR06]|nr:hypothetical protein HRbin06_00509 [archaeon HR06]
MSIRVKFRLQRLGLLELTTHEDRLEIDKEIEKITGLYCDEGVSLLSDEEFKRIVYEVINRRKKRKVEVISYA